MLWSNPASSSAVGATRMVGGSNDSPAVSQRLESSAQAAAQSVAATGGSHDPPHQAQPLRRVNAAERDVEQIGILDRADLLLDDLQIDGFDAASVLNMARPAALASPAGRNRRR